MNWLALAIAVLIYGVLMLGIAMLAGTWLRRRRLTDEQIERNRLASAYTDKAWGEKIRKGDL